MSNALIITAISVGVIHTILGPDHYIPFIAMSKAGNWSSKKTALITFLCGIAHVLSSAILGFLGIWFGINVLKLESFEGMRGDIAAWALIAFGLAYFVWGLRKAFKNNFQTDKKENITGWALFIVFVLGPCEPLVPILMYPAANGGNILYMSLTALVFGAATLATMLAVVMTSVYGLNFVNFKNMQKWAHACAGFAVLACGFSMKFLGL
jgi:sulfite exporter TauE/SafE